VQGVQLETLHWVLLAIVIYTAMFIVVPPAKGPELAPFGFWFGFVQAVVVLYLGQTHFKVFRLVGDPSFFGVPLISTVIWIVPAVFFAYFFPWAGTTIRKAVLVLIFAAGAAFAQYALDLMGLFENLRWNPFYTFLLAVFTHSNMLGYLLAKNRTAWR